MLRKAVQPSQSPEEIPQTVFVAVGTAHHSPDKTNDRTRVMTILNPALARVLKRLHYPLDVILTCVVGMWRIRRAFDTWKR